MNFLRIRATLWRIRHLVLALSLLLALAVVVDAVKGLHPKRIEVLVAAEDLPPGTILTASHMRLASVDAELIPENIVNKEENLVGATLTSTLPKGFPFSEKVLLNEEFLRFSPADTAIVPVTVNTQGMGKLLTPGRKIALYAPPSEHSGKNEAELLTEEAIIVGIGAENEKESYFTSDSSNKAEIYVAVPQASISLVLGYGSMLPMRVVIVPYPSQS